VLWPYVGFKISSSFHSLGVGALKVIQSKLAHLGELRENTRLSMMRGVAVSRLS